MLSLLVNGVWFQNDSSWEPTNCHTSMNNRLQNRFKCWYVFQPVFGSLLGPFWDHLEHLWGHFFGIFVGSGGLKKQGFRVLFRLSLHFFFDDSLMPFSLPFWTPKRPQNDPWGLGTNLRSNWGPQELVKYHVKNLPSNCPQQPSKNHLRRRCCALRFYNKRSNTEPI